jgi:hypothetical protein
MKLNKISNSRFGFGNKSDKGGNGPNKNVNTKVPEPAPGGGKPIIDKGKKSTLSTSSSSGVLTFEEPLRESSMTSQNKQDKYPINGKGGTVIHLSIDPSRIGRAPKPQKRSMLGKLKDLFRGNDKEMPVKRSQSFSSNISNKSNKSAASIDGKSSEGEEKLVFNRKKFLSELPPGSAFARGGNRFLSMDVGHHFVKVKDEEEISAPAGETSPGHDNLVKLRREDDSAPREFNDTGAYSITNHPGAVGKGPTLAFLEFDEDQNPPRLQFGVPDKEIRRYSRPISAGPNKPKSNEKLKSNLESFKSQQLLFNKNKDIYVEKHFEEISGEQIFKNIRNQFFTEKVEPPPSSDNRDRT